MMTDFYAPFATLNKTATDTYKALYAINMKTAKAISEKQFEMLDIYAATFTEQLELLGDVKELDKLIPAQTKLAKSAGEKVVAAAKSTQDIATAYKADVTSIVEKSVESAKATMKKAA
jgi:phasin family protein